MAEGDEKLALKDSSLEMWDSIWSGEHHEHEEGQGEGHEECHVNKEVQRYVIASSLSWKPLAICKGSYCHCP